MSHPTAAPAMTCGNAFLLLGLLGRLGKGSENESLVPPDHLNGLLRNLADHRCTSNPLPLPHTALFSFAYTSD